MRDVFVLQCVVYAGERVWHIRYAQWSYCAQYIYIYIWLYVYSKTQCVVPEIGTMLFLLCIIFAIKWLYRAWHMLNEMSCAWNRHNITFVTKVYTLLQTIRDIPNFARQTIACHCRLLRRKLLKSMCSVCCQTGHYHMFSTKPMQFLSCGKLLYTTKHSESLMNVLAAYQHSRPAQSSLSTICLHVRPAVAVQGFNFVEITMVGDW